MRTVYHPDGSIALLRKPFQPSKATAPRCLVKHEELCRVLSQRPKELPTGSFVQYSTTDDKEIVSSDSDFTDSHHQYGHPRFEVDVAPPAPPTIFDYAETPPSNIVQQPIQRCNSADARAMYPSAVASGIWGTLGNNYTGFPIEQVKPRKKRPDVFTLEAAPIRIRRPVPEANPQPQGAWAWPMMPDIEPPNASDALLQGIFDRNQRHTQR
jgi:hypothetical protein